MAPVITARAESGSDCRPQAWLWHAWLAQRAYRSQGPYHIDLLKHCPNVRKPVPTLASERLLKLPSDALYLRYPLAKSGLAAIFAAMDYTDML